jgi:hypothetical protein
MTWPSHIPSSIFINSSFNRGPSSVNL